MKRPAVAVLAWAGLLAVVGVPVLLAAASPYLAYRNLPYIVGGFAGIVCLALFVVQPLLAAGYLPGFAPATERRWHRWVGVAIVGCVILHVGGLYFTSPEDTLDALTLVAPTPFSVYGVLAMWGVLATAVLVALRRRFRYPTWYRLHNGLALVVVVATVEASAARHSTPLLTISIAPSICSACTTVAATTTSASPLCSRYHVG